MKTVIIPAAGLATRMKPLSTGVSKAMIPVNGRPLINYIIEHLEKSKDDTAEYIIVENSLKDIQKFLLRYPKIFSKCKFVQQEIFNGPLHAIDIARKVSDNKGPVTVWLGDTICLEDFDYNKDFLAVHKVSDPHRWCLIDSSGNLYDKPETDVMTDLALIGVYNFTSRDFFNESVELGMKSPMYKGEYQISALLYEYMKKIGKPMDLIETYEWYDCGELNSYYESKARLLKRTARSFNTIEVDTFFGTIKKSAEDAEKRHKIEEEKLWFKSLNENQSLFCPRILNSEYGTLKMTLEPGIALNEVLVYDNLRIDVWHDIIRKILNIHHEVFFCKDLDNYNSPERICYEQYFILYRKRIEEILETFKLSEKDKNKIKSFFKDTSSELYKNPSWSGVIHGDSHLGNIIYDAYSGNIKFVDPRGRFGGHIGTIGDMRYDMGKLMQDFYCGYSMIMAGQYEMNNNQVDINWIGNTENLQYFLSAQLEELGYDIVIIKKLAILLLLTAIPFHADNPERQEVFLYRCLNLIEIL